MTTEEQIEKFNALFDPDKFENNDLDSKEQYTEFFAELMSGLVQEKAIEMLLNSLKARNPSEEIESYLMAMYLTGISTWRYALITAKPELADAVREFELEYILGEK